MGICRRCGRHIQESDAITTSLVCGSCIIEEIALGIYPEFCSDTASISKAKKLRATWKKDGTWFKRLKERCEHKNKCSSKKCPFKVIELPTCFTKKEKEK